MPEENAYIPDSQIIYPAVFLSDIPILQYPNCAYRDCFKILTQEKNYVVLPNGYLDFSSLILDKFYQFLKNIETEIISARNNKTSETDFYKKTWSRLRSITAFQKNLGDLLLYWDTHRETFWLLVSLDFVRSRRELLRITNKMIAEFEKLSANHLVEFSATERQMSAELYNLIRKAKSDKKLTHQIHDEDALILADCFIYKGSQYPDGFLYLITNDNDLYGTTEEIVKAPSLILDGFEATEHYVGFEPLRPTKYLSDRKKK